MDSVEAWIGRLASALSGAPLREWGTQLVSKQHSLTCLEMDAVNRDAPECNIDRKRRNGKVTAY